MSPATTNKLWFKTPADIVERRKKLGLTQTNFWAKVGITQSGGCRFESGRNIPRPVMLQGNRTELS
jgi:predicted transcriptional regulator